MRTAGRIALSLGILLVFGAMSCTQESASPEERGEELLRGLRPFDLADADTAYFEALLGGKVCGVAELSLTPYMEENRLLYEYRYLLTLRLTRTSMFLRSMNMVLDPKFAPIETTDEKMTLGLQGPMDRTRTMATVGADRISIQELQQGTESSREVDAPERPFVMCASHILKLAKPQAGSSFSLPILNISDGTVTHRLFKATSGSDGVVHVEVVDEEGKPAGHYELDADGELESFQEKAAAWVMERTTKEKILAFQQSWTRDLGAGAEADSQTTPGTEPEDNE